MLEILAKRIKQSLLPALAAAVVSGLVAPVGVRAEAVVTTSVWCDKAEQVETVARAHLADGMTIEIAMERVNVAAEDPGACSAGTVVAVDMGKARRFVTANRLLSIGEFLVIGVIKNGQIVPIEPVKWYAATVVGKVDLM